MTENKSKCITLKMLFNKEVVNTQSGERLGYIDDADIDMECGLIKCFYVTSHCPPFSKKKERRKFSFDDIAKIGNDIILVKTCFNAPKNNKKVL